MKPLHAMAPSPVLPAAAPLKARQTDSMRAGAASAAAILAATAGRAGSIPPHPAKSGAEKVAPEAGRAAKPRPNRKDTRRAEIESGWVAAARRALDLDADEPPLRHRWLLDTGDSEADMRILAELGRWALQLGAVHCRRAAGVAARRYEEMRSRKDARRKIGKSLRELRLFMTARQRQMKRRRRDSLLLQLAEVVDRYRVAHPERSPEQIRASVDELLKGITEGRRVAA